MRLGDLAVALIQWSCGVSRSVVWLIRIVVGGGGVLPHLRVEGPENGVRFFFEKLVAFSETARASPRPLLYPEPVESSTHFETLKLKLCFNIILTCILMGTFSLLLCSLRRLKHRLCEWHNWTTKLFIYSVRCLSPMTSNFVVDLNRKKRFLNSNISLGTLYRVKEHICFVVVLTCWKIRFQRCSLQDHRTVWTAIFPITNKRWRN